MLRTPRRRGALLIFAALVVPTILCHSAAVQAQTQTVYSPVILGLDASTARQFQIREDGSGFQFLPNCPANGCGDLSHNGVAGKRYFITAELPPGCSRPECSLPLDLVVYSEDGGSRTVLINNKAFDPEMSSNIIWSSDGNRIAYPGKLCYAIDTNGQCLFKHGLIVGEVVHDSSGVPVAVDNERLVVEVSSEFLSSISWAPDNQRLAYVLGRLPPGCFRPACTLPVEWFINVVYAPPYPELPATTKLLFSDGDQSNGTALSFSPVTGRDQQGNAYFRLAFSRFTDAPGNSNNVRADIWVVEVPSGYNGSYMLVPRRVTTSTNAKNTYALARFDWSPDEQWLAYDGYTSALSVRNLYKIRSDGSGKSIALTNSRRDNYVVSGWRK